MEIKLRGITWNHSRGYLPVVATSQRFHELRPEVEITWARRSLQAFADQPIEELAEQFDLLVIDHPFVGAAAAHGTFLPLENDQEFLEDQASHSVGQSHASYAYGGHHWAYAIDAATPVSSWRPDLLSFHKLSLPRTWNELMELASDGWVRVPAIPIDMLMSFYMLCRALGAELFRTPEQVTPYEAGAQALELLRDLVGRCAPECLKQNPIAVYESMSGKDETAYCPFAFGYSNYARSGYARRKLKFGDLVAFDGNISLSSTLGGTGLAVSAATRYPELARAYARFVADAECQRTIYAQNGGQPGHRGAWLDPQLNRLTDNYFKDTLPALDRAYLRPRYDGYLGFQDSAAKVVYQFIEAGGDPGVTLGRIDQLYQNSRKT